MKCLYKYKAPSFIEYIENDLKISNWKIMLDDIENRYSYISNSNYAIKLEEKGYELNFFEDDYDNYEIIAWIDSASILYRTLLNMKKLFLNSITVIAEFLIPNTNNRCDFLLIKDNKILILEFTNSLHENKQKIYKEKQLLNYKNKIIQLINNSNIEVYTKLIKYDQEYGYEENPYDQYDYEYQEYINYNDKLINSLAKYITNLFSNTNNKIQALEYLENNYTNFNNNELISKIKELESKNQQLQTKLDLIYDFINSLKK